MILNIFYDEPDPDRWFPYDRYVRKGIRRIVRGKPKIGGQKRIFINLLAGLKKINYSFRINDYKYAINHPNELVCIIGKPFVLDLIDWKNPILFGAAIFSHPTDDPDLLIRRPVKKILVPGPWYKEMFKPWYGNNVQVWPIGVDTNIWNPNFKENNCDIDVLIYDKILWSHDIVKKRFIRNIINYLQKKGKNIYVLTYGDYKENEYWKLLCRCKSMVYLCEHEAQGIALLQAMAFEIPVLVWEQGEYWLDPSYYPHTIKFGPVKTAPYWNQNCGMKFKMWDEFPSTFDLFWERLKNKEYKPREYVLDKLTLEKSATDYIEIVNSLI